MEHLYNYSLEELTEYFKSINEKPFRAKQVFQWLYQKMLLIFKKCLIYQRFKRKIGKTMHH